VNARVRNCRTTTHVVDQAVLVPDTELLKLGLVLSVVDLLEDVLPLRGGKNGEYCFSSPVAKIKRTWPSYPFKIVFLVDMYRGSFFSIAILNEDCAKSVMLQSREWKSLESAVFHIP
jgi:hypothetical protein